MVIQFFESENEPIGYVGEVWHSSTSSYDVGQAFEISTYSYGQISDNAKATFAEVYFFDYYVASTEDLDLNTNIYHETVHITK